MAQSSRPVASAGLVIFIAVTEIARAPTPINHLPSNLSYMQDPLQERHRRSHQPGRRLWGTPSPCGGTLTHGRAGDQWRGDGQDSHAGVPTGIKREEVRGPWGFDPSTRSRRHAEASA